MIFKTINIIKNIIRIPIFLTDGFVFFDRTHVLRKYSFDLELMWISIPLNYGYGFTENSNYFFVYQFEKLFIVSKENGIVKKTIDSPFFLHSAREKVLYGEMHLEGKKYVYKYVLEEDIFFQQFKIATDYYCHSIYRDYGFFVDEITYRKIHVRSLVNGNIIWEFETESVCLSLLIYFFSETIIIREDSGNLTALDLQTGKIEWHKNITISALDKENGLIYVLGHDYLVIDVVTGEEVIRVNDWRGQQLSQYPALEYFNSNCTLSENYLVFLAKSTLGEFGEGGIFFIDKTTAEVKEYFRIVFDKDPVQRRDWDGNRIPDDEQIPFMPLEKPIYKDGRLYVVLPSPIEGQKDLYVYEREE